MTVHIETDGRRLWVERAGTGSPVVLLEAGLDCPGELWDPIWQGLQAFTSVIRYDRSNLGQSDPAPSPRTPEALVEDLRTVLREVGGTGPYVLVGHSFGGLLVRLYADRWPERVAGMVLIDASHHEQNRRMAALLPSSGPGESEKVSALRRGYADSGALSIEGVNFGSIQAATSLTRPLGDLPLAVLSRSLPADSEELARRRPGLPTELAAEMEGLWQRLQRELAGLSRQSTHLVAGRGGHFLHHDDPSLVVEAIRNLVASVR